MTSLLQKDPLPLTLPETPHSGTDVNNPKCKPKEKLETVSSVRATTTYHNPLDGTGFLRLKQILGDPNASPPIPAIIPVSRSTWYSGIKNNRFPNSVRIGNGHGAFWRVEDIRSLIASAK